MKYRVDEIPICLECDGHDEYLQCKKCGVHYCHHYASPTDQRYCHNCLGDFSIIETHITKEEIHKDKAGNVKYVRRQYGKNMELTGTDWLFTARKIPELSDDELLGCIEYHRAIMGIMLSERESRRTEQLNKLASIKVAPVTRKSKLEEEQDAAKGAKKTATVKKKTTSSQDLLKAMEMLMKAGMTKAQLEQMMGKK